MKNGKSAVVFPGIGYHTDKPLLYYAKKLARQAGYTVQEIRYGAFEDKTKIRGNREQMERAFDSAYEDVKAQLDTEELRGADVLFIGKSIGTIAACAFAEAFQIPARQILYTPLEDTFRFITKKGRADDCIAFFGSSDQWTDPEILRRACEERRMPFHVYEHGNHSIETGDVDTDLGNLRDVMRHTAAFIGAQRFKA